VKRKPSCRFRLGERIVHIAESAPESFGKQEDRGPWGYVLNGSRRSSAPRKNLYLVAFASAWVLEPKKPQFIC